VEGDIKHSTALEEQARDALRQPGGEGCDITGLRAAASGWCERTLPFEVGEICLLEYLFSVYTLSPACSIRQRIRINCVLTAWNKHSNIGCLCYWRVLDMDPAWRIFIRLKECIKITSSDCLSIRKRTGGKSIVRLPNEVKFPR